MLVFYHIPKTAGMSVVKAAAAAIPGSHRRVFLTEMRAWMTALDQGDPDLGSTAFLSGHFAYGVHERLEGGPRCFTFLRNPVEQSVSMHHESAKRPDIYPHGDLRDLLTNGRGEPYFGNPQVRHLASTDGRPVTGPLTAAHLSRAIDVVINQMTCFGITEFFGASITLINEYLSTDLTPKRENVSGRSVSDVDPALLSLIWDANELDRQLYEHCRGVFLERLKTLRSVQPLAGGPNHS